MKESKIKDNIIVFIIVTIFVIYSIVFIMVNMGYYEYKNYTKKVFTEEQIIKFENDIKNGVILDVNDYLVSDQINDKKQLSLKISKFIGNLSRLGIGKIFKMLNKIVET